MKNLALTIIFCLTTNLLLSQNNNSNKKRENREAIKIAFFTKKMDLNTVESQNFWPLVNDMEAELKALRNKNSHGRMMLKDKEEISDKELEEIMDAKMEMGKSQIDIKIKYHEKFKEVLPIKKVAKYYEANKEFKKIQTQRKTHHSNPGQRNR
tara:strand:- start:2051 stop:2509 length:459 start_codon:yes stop_codon:yes gene_type:complete